MIQGRLQPALKYIAQNPMFNRYKVKNPDNQSYQEIVTYPTVAGDLKMKNKHVGVNFDDRDIPAKELPGEDVVEHKKMGDLQGVVKKLQNKNIKYNRDYYSQVKRKNMRAVDPKDIDDPRTLGDIERENMDLKEQFLHQMMTLESYMNVAYLWMAEKEEGFNPYESRQEIENLQNEVNYASDESPMVQRGGDNMSDSAWADYADMDSTVAKVENNDRHENKFDYEAYQKGLGEKSIVVVDKIKKTEKIK